MRELRIDTVHGQMTALRAGQEGAPRVLAVHGWLDNAASFVPLLAHLGDFDVLAIDLPGHGHSFHRPPGASYGLPEYLDDLLNALDAIGWARCHLLGHSLGGAISSMLACAAPERVEKLALIEALGPLAGAPGSAAERLRQAVSERRALRSKQLRTFPDIFTAVRARVQANGLSEHAARLLVERGIAPVEGGFLWCSDPRLTTTTALRADESTVREWIAGIAAPTLVIAAEQAPPYFDAALRQARIACLRDGRSLQLPGGHHLHMETPEPVAVAIARFFAG
ncbi:MAG: alpha/beta hydrolase [Xanthomonadaceae bacterium]|nr:alpha/beta hydrolase [Xanthomonadaceae bacterium]MDP2186851.1 alpha/beta hydrolase [Xanthomonadales bacterium]MDZ4114944.1 alpha/beta hydrolase [Xanthomonadaceae bacterium]MDZ4376889.1 alpha/beta hydrolase [Xanthomonadaceae bacterium]